MYFLHIFLVRYFFTVLVIFRSFGICLLPRLSFMLITRKQRCHHHGWDLKKFTSEGEHHFLWLWHFFPYTINSQNVVCLWQMQKYAMQVKSLGTHSGLLPPGQFKSIGLSYSLLTTPSDSIPVRVDGFLTTGLAAQLSVWFALCLSFQDL